MPKHIHKFTFRQTAKGMQRKCRCGLCITEVPQGVFGNPVNKKNMAKAKETLRKARDRYYRRMKKKVNTVLE